MERTVAMLAVLHDNATVLLTSSLTRSSLSKFCTNLDVFAEYLARSIDITGLTIDIANLYVNAIAEIHKMEVPKVCDIVTEAISRYEI